MAHPGRSSGRQTTAQSSRKASSFAGLKPVKLRLPSNNQATAGSVGGTLATANDVALNSSTFPELTAITSVYDEMRVLGVHLRYYPFVAIAGTSSVVCAVAIGFDAAEGTPGSSAGVLQNTFSSNLMFVPGGVTGTVQSFGVTEFKDLRAYPPAALAPITSDDMPGSAWFALDGIATTAPTICTFLAFGSSIGGAGQLDISWQIELDVEVRLRN
jgi:hypothetical protein